MKTSSPRAAIGARLLTARGAGMRLVSVASNIALIVLVAPADLGLLAVVRGIAGLAGDTSDLGFAWALLRRHTAPSDDEYRALGGVQLTLVLASSPSPWSSHHCWATGTRSAVASPLDARACSRRCSWSRSAPARGSGSNARWISSESPSPISPACCCRT